MRPCRNEKGDHIMNANEILELVRAGFTKAEIMAFSTGSENAPQDANPEPEQEPAEPANVPQNGEKPAETTKEQPAAQGTELDRLYKQLSALTAAIQGQNRADAEQGASIIEPYENGIKTIRDLVGIPAEQK